jgi:biotin synthase
MIVEKLSFIAQQVIDGKAVSHEEAMWLSEIGHEYSNHLFQAASRIRDHFVGRRARCCSIVASKVGRCSENCTFCSQSAHYDTPVEGETILSDDKILSAAAEAERNGARAFGIVNSGLGPTDEETMRWGRTLSRLRDRNSLQICASLGVLQPSQAERLKEHGCECYNHNLQTSRRHFPAIISTHSYDDRLETLRRVKQAGMHLCSGALFGMGETWEDRIDLAMELRDIEPDIIPLNFLIPIDGTPLAGSGRMDSMECLKIIAVYRFLFPKEEIKIAGGRESNLGELQGRMFEAGADSFLIGNYLTTFGRSPEEDRQMVQELGMQLEKPERTQTEEQTSLSESWQNATS